MGYPKRCLSPSVPAPAMNIFASARARALLIPLELRSTIVLVWLWLFIVDSATTRTGNAAIHENTTEDSHSQEPVAYQYSAWFPGSFVCGLQFLVLAAPWLAGRILKAMNVGIRVNSSISLGYAYSSKVRFSACLELSIPLPPRPFACLRLRHKLSDRRSKSTSHPFSGVS